MCEHSRFHDVPGMGPERKETKRGIGGKHEMVSKLSSTTRSEGRRTRDFATGQTSSCQGTTQTKVRKVTTQRWPQRENKARMCFEEIVHQQGDSTLM